MAAASAQRAQHDSCVCVFARARACAPGHRNGEFERTHARHIYACLPEPALAAGKITHPAYVHLGTRHTQQLFSLRLPESALEWQICTYVTKFDNQLQVSVLSEM